MLRALIARFLPDTSRQIEAESRSWMVRCPSCGHEISVWEAGGMRYKARGTPRKLGRCTQCDFFGMLEVYKKA